MDAELPWPAEFEQGFIPLCSCDDRCLHHDVGHGTLADDCNCDQVCGQHGARPETAIVDEQLRLRDEQDGWSRSARLRTEIGGWSAVVVQIAFALVSVTVAASVVVAIVTGEAGLKQLIELAADVIGRAGT